MWEFYERNYDYDNWMDNGKTRKQEKEEKRKKMRVKNENS